MDLNFENKDIFLLIVSINTVAAPWPADCEEVAILSSPLPILFGGDIISR